MSRKMVLVPEAMLNELKGKLPKPPEFQSTIGLRSDLDAIEHRDDLTPEEKVGLYGHQLHRYRQYLHQARQQPTTSTPPVAPTPPGAPEATPPVSDDLDTQIIKSVSKTGQKKAGLLLDHLKKSKVLTWNKEGEVSYRGQRVPDSNIVDLMSESQRQRPLKHHDAPAGLQEFAQALKETNAPKAYLSNQAVIKAMDKPGKISTPKPVDESGFQEASNLDDSFYETPRRMTPKYMRDALSSKQIRDGSKKTSKEIAGWLNLPQ